MGRTLYFQWDMKDAHTILGTWKTVGHIMFDLGMDFVIKGMNKRKVM
jgi:hypothetical protein